MKPLDVDGDTTYDVTEHYWFPMLAGLSDLTSDPRAEVCSCALEVLFDLLDERGRKFSTSFWENIFQRVLFPIFDNFRQPGSFNSSGDDSLRESSIHSLKLLCDLFNKFYKVLVTPLYTELVFPDLQSILGITHTELVNPLCNLCSTVSDSDFILLRQYIYLCNTGSVLYVASSTEFAFRLR